MTWYSSLCCKIRFDHILLFIACAIFFEMIITRAANPKSDLASLVLFTISAICLKRAFSIMYWEAIAEAATAATRKSSSSSASAKTALVERFAVVAVEEATEEAAKEAMKKATKEAVTELEVVVVRAEGAVGTLAVIMVKVAVTAEAKEAVKEAVMKEAITFRLLMTVVKAKKAAAAAAVAVNKA